MCKERAQPLSVGVLSFMIALQRYGKKNYHANKLTIFLHKTFLYVWRGYISKTYTSKNGIFGRFYGISRGGDILIRFAGDRRYIGRFWGKNGNVWVLRPYVCARPCLLPIAAIAYTYTRTRVCARGAGRRNHTTHHTSRNDHKPNQ